MSGGIAPRRRGNTRTGTYAGLDTGPLVSVNIGTDALVAMVDTANYGAHRFLSALAKRRLADDPEDPLGKGVKALLDSGVY